MITYEIEPIIACPNEIVFPNSSMTTADFFAKAIGDGGEGWNFDGTLVAEILSFGNIPKNFLYHMVIF